jgi:hypothetical protein
MGKQAAQPEEPPAVLPDVQKAFWLRGDLHARLVELLAKRRKTNPRATERELLTEAVERLVAGRADL